MRVLFFFYSFLMFGLFYILLWRADKKEETCRNQKVLFPCIVSDAKVEMRRVYPTKQKMVKDVIDQLRGDERINSLRLFGSSITMRCNKDSDIDFAIELAEISDSVKNEISEMIQLACDWTADIIWLDRITSEDRIYKDIMEGVVLI